MILYDKIVKEGTLIKDIPIGTKFLDIVNGKWERIEDQEINESLVWAKSVDNIISCFGTCAKGLPL